MLHIILEWIVVYLAVRAVARPMVKRWPLAHSIGKNLRRIFYPSVIAVTSTIFFCAALPICMLFDVAKGLLLGLFSVAVLSTIWAMIASHYTEKEIRTRLGIPLDQKIEPEADLVDVAVAAFGPKRNPILDKIGM